MKRTGTVPILVMAALLAGIAFLSGCNRGKVNSQPGTVDKSKKLLIYSNSGADGKGDWVTERAKQEGWNITVVDIPGGELLNRAIAEKNNQLADMVWGLNAMSYERLKKEGLLMKFDPPSWVSDVDMTIGDPEGCYYPIVVQPLIMVYKTNIFPAESAPKDWVEAATSPRFKGKVNILALNGGTSQSLIAGILIRYRDAGGELGISKEGWDVMRQYIQNGYVNRPDEDWLSNFTSEKYPITGLWGSGYFQRINEFKLTNLDYASPEIGAPYVVEQLAIFNGTKNTELAKAFIDWFGSPQIQGEFSEKFGTAPASKTALAKAAPDIRSMLERLHPQEIDWKFVGANLEAWMEKINLEFVK
jgi:iron(III) transport system substrate-binding protein